MSIETSAWARKQSVGDALAKSLLRAVADYAGEEWTCFPSLRRLSSDCELSEDTVRRKLKLLEDAGFLVRIKSWMDEYGRRNLDGRGRETSHEIRLLRDRPADDPPPQPDDSGTDEGSQSARVAACEPSTDEGGGVALVPPLVEPSLEKKDSPPNPPSGGGVADAALLESIKPFSEVYPAPVTDMQRALQVWSALTEPERQDSITGARGYASFIESERKRTGGKGRGVKDAHRWLGSKGWIGYLDQGRRIVTAAQAPTSAYFAKDSPEGKAIEAMFAMTRSPPPTSPDGERYQLRATITLQLLAMQNAGDDRGWPVIENHQQIAAWNEFIKPIIGRAPLLDDHVAERVYRKDDAGNDVFSHAVRKHGIKAPWPWPPRKDGTISVAASATPLPESLES